MEGASSQYSAEGSWSIEVHEDVSFLKVRDTDQLLQHPKSVQKTPPCASRSMPRS